MGLSIIVCIVAGVGWGCGLRSSSQPDTAHRECSKTTLASGKNYDIFHAGPSNPVCELAVTMLGDPGQIMEHLQGRMQWLDTISDTGDSTTQSVQQRAREAYLEMLQTHVSGLVFGRAEKSVTPKLGRGKVSTRTLDKRSRESGEDWTYLGSTMVGSKRLMNVEDLVGRVLQEGVPGDYIETGVWRGGASVFARGVIRSFEGQGGTRKSYVCDSFQGLPPASPEFSKMATGESGWDHTHYLEVSEELVMEDFAAYSLLDNNVIFVKGFFSDTMPPLSNMIEKLAVMRLDGDMYQSTADVLYNMYGKLSTGGYVIIDDWFGFPAKKACEDFLKVHNLHPTIVPIDHLAAYWKKEEEVEIQYWRYEQKKFLD